MKTKQEQIEEMTEKMQRCFEKNGLLNFKWFAEALYNAGYRKIDEFEKCRKCPAWSGTDCTRNPYTEGCLDDKVNLKNEIKRLEKENEQLKAKLEARLTCDFVKARQNYAVQDFAEKLKERFTQYNNTDDVDIVASVNYELNEMLKEYKE